MNLYLRLVLALVSGFRGPPLVEADAEIPGTDPAPALGRTLVFLRARFH